MPRYPPLLTQKTGAVLGLLLIGLLAVTTLASTVTIKYAFADRVTAVVVDVKLGTCGSGRGGLRTLCWHPIIATNEPNEPGYTGPMQGGPVVRRAVDPDGSSLLGRQLTVLIADSTPVAASEPLFSGLLALLSATGAGFLSRVIYPRLPATQERTRRRRQKAGRAKRQVTLTARKNRTDPHQPE